MRGVNRPLSAETTLDVRIPRRQVLHDSPFRKLEVLIRHVNSLYGRERVQHGEALWKRYSSRAARCDEETMSDSVDQSQSSPTTIPIRLMRSIFRTVPRDEDLPTWGFPFHSSCWDVLDVAAADEPLDIQAVFDVFRSFPICRDLMHFGHDYGGFLEEYQLVGKQPDPGREPYLVKRTDSDAVRMEASDPMDLHAAWAILGAASKENFGLNGFEYEESKVSNPSDKFSKLSDDLLDLLLGWIPSKDIVSLKLASRTFAKTPLSDSFWKSRFLLGHEFEFMFESRESNRSRQLGGRWKGLYFSMRNSPSWFLKNRKRLWDVTCIFRDTVRRQVKFKCHGAPAQSPFEPDAPPHDHDWTTASRCLSRPDVEFLFGGRALFERVIELTTEIKQVFISTVKLFSETTYISGMRYVLENEAVLELGYVNVDTEEEISLDKRSKFIGYELAHDMHGICGIALLFDDESKSSWVGEYDNLSRRRLVWKHSGASAVRYLKGGFDVRRL